MSLEAKIESLIEALNANTAALKGAKPGSTGTGDTASKGGKGGKSAPAEEKPKHNAEQVKAAAVKVKDKLGTSAAKDLIKEVGKADELMKIKPENYDAFVAAAEKALAGADEEEGGDDL